MAQSAVPWLTNDHVIYKKLQSIIVRFNDEKCSE